MNFSSTVESTIELGAIGQFDDGGQLVVMFVVVVMVLIPSNTGDVAFFHNYWKKIKIHILG